MKHISCFRSETISCGCKVQPVSFAGGTNGAQHHNLPGATIVFLFFSSFFYPLVLSCNKTKEMALVCVFVCARVGACAQSVNRRKENKLFLEKL